MKNSKLFLTLTTIVLGVASPAMGETFINSCADATIGTGGVYVLNADLPCGILVTVNNVTLKLNGHILTGPGIYGFGIIIPFNGDHVAIQGPGLVRNFYIGVIAFSGIQSSQIKGVTVSQNGIGMYFYRASSVTIESNLVVGNDTGVYAGYVSNSSFSFNEVSGNSELGANFNGISGSKVNNNVASGNGGSGILFSLFDNAPNIDTTRVYSNTTNGNSESGIRVEPSGIFLNIDNKFFKNFSKGNKVFDFEDSDPCLRHVWADNVFFTANQTCIR